MLTFEEFEKLPEDATIYVIVAGELITCKKADLHTYKITGMFDREVPSIPLYRRADLILWGNCFLDEREAGRAYIGIRSAWFGIGDEIVLKEAFKKLRKDHKAFQKGGETIVPNEVCKKFVIPKDTTIPQRSTCGVPYAPPRTMHLPKEICKKIISGKMTKLIENFPRLPLDYELVVEGEDKSFATIQVFSLERFDLFDRVADLKTLLEAVWDSRGEITLSDGDDLAFCRSCGFRSIEDFVTHYDKAPTCSYYIHTIYPLIVDANKFEL